MSDWHAGAATAILDVHEGTRLGGYADRTEGATCTHDPLEISALSLTCDGRWLHIVTADVVGVDGGLAADIAAAAGVDASDILLCATHTHSGPLGVPRRLHPASPTTIEPDLRAHFIEVAAGAVSEATGAMRPVVLAAGASRVDGAWTNRNDPDATGDDQVRYLAATGDEGSLVALLMLVPCHPTVLGAWNLEVSADLHGGIRRAVRARLGAAGQDATLLTATGAAGDISTRFSRRESSFAEVDRLGDIVAGAVLNGLGHATLTGGGLRRASETVTLPMRERDLENEAVAHRDALAAWKAAEDDPTVPEAVKRRLYTRLQGAAILRETGNVAPVSMTIDCWLLGDTLALTAAPGEPFSSHARRVEQGSPFDMTWVVGYANGYVGYIVDDAAIEAGTYEALASPYGPGASEVVVSAATKALRALV